VNRQDDNIIMMNAAHYIEVWDAGNLENVGDNESVSHRKTTVMKKVKR